MHASMSEIERDNVFLAVRTSYEQVSQSAYLIEKSYELLETMKARADDLDDESQF